jgi:hypothetical protein
MNARPLNLIAGKTHKGNATMSSNNIDSVEVFYGNGTIYLTGRESVERFNEYNFSVESLRDNSSLDYWVTDEVIVALGCDVSRKQAIERLHRVIERMESEMRKPRRHK